MKEIQSILKTTAATKELQQEIEKELKAESQEKSIAKLLEESE